MFMTPDVSIIITTRNRASHLRQTLEAMREVALPEGLSAELVVVDNGSTDATAEVVQGCRLEQMPLRYLLEPTSGQCRARNAGIAATQSPLLLFTDDDVRPSANWLSGMTTPLRSGKADAVAGGVRLASHVLRPWMAKPHRTMLAENLGEDKDNPSVVGANFALGRHVLARIPAFDTELGPGALGFADDSLFGFQLREAGYRVWDGSAVTVEHHPDTSRLQRAHYVDHAARLGRSFGYFDYHWKHETVRALPLRKWRAALKLWQRREPIQRAWASDEGASPEEIVLIYQLHRYRQYQIEARKPRHYDRHGLVKRTA